MNIHDKKIAAPKDARGPNVTTGPLIGSRKVHSSPDGYETLRVPLREILVVTFTEGT